MAGLTGIWALPALSKEAGQSKSAGSSQTDRELRFFEQISHQFEQGLPVTDAEKEEYLALESRYGDVRGRDNLDNQGGPDAFQYMFMDNVPPDNTPYEWIELRGDAGATWLQGMTHFTSPDDGYSRRQLPIGFSFPLYNVNYDCVRVCTNGFLQFAGTPSTSLSNACLPSTEVAGPMIAVLWDDLHLLYGGRTDTVVVGYRNFGDYFVIEFDSLGHCCSDGGSFKFEAILYPNGNIKLQYNNLVFSSWPQTQSIGIQQAGAVGSAALNYVCNTTGIQPTNGLAILFARATGVPNPVTDLAVQYIAPNVVLTWTDPTQDTQGNPITPTNIQVWLGPAGTGTLLATVDPGMQSYVHFNAPDGHLTYTVRPFNDPYYGASASVPLTVGTPGYTSNFDSNNGQWVATPATGGWEWGIPWGIGGLIPHSVPNVWGTVVAGNYTDNACWQLDLNLGLVVTSEAATVEFYHWFYSQASYDGCNFKVSVDNGATWTVLTPTQGGYSTTALLATTCMTGQAAWAGLTPHAWSHCVIPIGQYVGQVPIFRFEFSSNASTSTYPGFYFDDLEIWGVSGQQSGIPTACTNLVGNYVAPNVVLTWLDPTLDSQGNPLLIDSVQIWLGAAGSGTRLGSVSPGVQTFTHLNAPIAIQTYTVRPCHDSFFGPPVSVPVTVGVPTYDNDFNADNGMWVPTPETGGWSWGAPTNVAAPAPHSAPNYWGTGLAANYPNSACWQLDLNLGLAVLNTQATVEFWRWYYTEQSFDGVNFKVSVDQGATWTLVQPVGNYPYTASTANVCIPSEPYWAGLSQTWTPVTIPLGQFLGQTPIFRFTFGSDASVVYPGFFFDDMVIWGLAFPETTHVSGRVTLDGIGGAVTSVAVAANGIGSPTTHPSADSTYSLDGVQVGNRTLIASLTGYISDTNAVAVPSGGLTNHNFLLRRVNPPAPTGLTGSVNTATGVVTLDWADSPDLQVDEYKIYRKLRADQTWTFRRAVIGRTNSQGTDSLTVGGIYQYYVTAADTNVIPPAAESAPSSQIELAYGALPPQALAADTAFDNKIRLMWIDPLSQPVDTVEIYYDSVDVDPGCVFDGLGFTSQLPFAWFAAHYQGTGAITIYRVKTRHWPQSTPGCPVQVAVFEDAGNGTPTFTPLGVKDTVITDPTAWLDVELTTPVTVTSGSFFVGIRQVTAQRVDIGMDSCAVQHTNTFFYTTDVTAPWATLESVPFPQVLVIRAIVAGNIGGGLMELAPSPVQVTTWPVATVQDVAAKSSEIGKALALDAMNSPRAPISANFLAPVVSPLLRPAATVFRPGVRPYGTENRGHSTLDDVIRYLVYRNTVRIDSVLGTLLQYDNIVGSANENVPYTYYVTARYDNGQESPPSNTITARCGLPPGAPTNLTLTRVGTTQMRIQWTNPTLNADGTPCVDYAGSKVYRDGTLLSTVGAGILQYTDTPPSPTSWYTWMVRGIDEVPNEGPGASESGVAGNPSYESNFNADNGQWVPTPPTGGWAWGAPTNPTAPIPYSAPNYWGTGLTANYGNSVDYKVDLDLDLVVQSATARVEFWFRYDTENSYDGCNFKASVNGGTTWTVLTPSQGAYTVTAMSTANAFMGGQPAWSGHTQTAWQYAVIPIGQFVDQTPIFRLEFSSDPSVSGYMGFFFDDMLIWGLQPASAIMGLVRAFQTNLPIANARVWAQGQPDTITTDALGSYLFPLDSGAYTLWFRHMHFCDTVHTNVVVETGSQTVHNAVMRAPHGQVSVTSLTLETPEGENTEETFTISNTGGQCPLSYAISDDSEWLSVTPDGGTVAPDETATITVRATVTGMAQGDYVSALLLTYNSVGSPADIRVDLHIGPSAVDANLPLPTEFAYYQNYPNPFNATTALRFDVPQQSRVEIAIFNIMGQEVARPVDEVYVPGRYRLLFDAGRLPSGMYLVKMTAADYTQIGKMMLLK
jgi:hypothetical protein